MPLTLWRGSEQIGVLTEPLPTVSPHMFAFRLQLSGSDRHLEEVTQVQLRLAPGSPVIQHPIGPPTGRSEYPLTPLTDDQLEGVPSSAEYVIRDGSSEVVEIEGLTLERERRGPGQGVAPDRAQWIVYGGTFDQRLSDGVSPDSQPRI